MVVLIYIIKKLSRKVGRESLYVRWDLARPISYDFAETVPLETRHKIRAAIEMWEKRTCVRFQENGPNVDRIEFFDGGGCSSFVGRTGGTQVNLENHFLKNCYYCFLQNPT